MRAKIGDGALGFDHRHMLQHLNGDDQVVFAGKRFSHRANPTVWARRRMNILNRVLRDIHPIGFHPALAQRFDEEAQSATGIQHGRRTDVADDAIGDGAKELHP